MDFQKELIAEFERETTSTRKLLEAIPEDADFSWKPHTKSMTLGKLADHVADTNGSWALHALTTDKLEWTPDMNEAPPANKAELMQRYARHVPEVKPALEAMTPETWASSWKMVAGDRTWIDDTKYNVWRTWVIDHMIHHRAQLGVYLRLLDVSIPGMYGPSADQMPAEAEAQTV